MFLRIRNWWFQQLAIWRHCPKGWSAMRIHEAGGSQYRIAKIEFQLPSYDDCDTHPTYLLVFKWHGREFFLPARDVHLTRNHYAETRHVVMTGKSITVEITGVDGNRRTFEPPYPGKYPLDKWYDQWQAYNALFTAWATGQISVRTFDSICELMRKQKLMLEGLNIITFQLEGLIASGPSFKSLHNWIQVLALWSLPGSCMSELEKIVYTPPDIGGRHRVTVEA